MARSKKSQAQSISSLLVLALTNKNIKEENIIRMVSLLDESHRIGAVEILNGVDSTPELSIPKNTYKMWGFWSKIVEYKWNPLTHQVDCKFSNYETITVNHPYTDDSDIQLLKERFFACTSLDQAKGIPSAGNHQIKLVINSLVSSVTRESYSIIQWEKICKSDDYLGIDISKDYAMTI